MASVTVVANDAAASPRRRGHRLALALALGALRAVGLTVGITAIVFFLVRMIPGDAVDVAAIQGDLTYQQQSVLREQLGLTVDWWGQFWLWVGNALEGDFGNSLRFHRPVADMILNALPTTLALGFLALGIGLVLGIGTATLAMLFPRSPFVWLVNAINIWSISVPTFSIGVVGLIVFAIWLGWISALGNLIVPAAILGLDVAGQLAKMLHEDLKDSSLAQYVRTARAKGLHPARIVLRHILPNSLSVVLAISGIVMAGIIGGAITMEVVFGLNGIGSLVLQAMKGRDYPVIQAVIVLLALSVVVVNFVTDALQRLFDPRLRGVR